jgi:hypothetical protein
MTVAATHSRSTGPVDASVLGALVTALVTELRRVDPSGDADRIELLRLLECVKCAAAGAQARITAKLSDSQCTAQREARRCHP